MRAHLLVSCLVVSGLAAAAEPAYLYVVEASSVELIRKKADQDVPKSNPSDIVVSNSCGDFRARFTVVKTIIGPTERLLKVTGSIGEWCNLPFSASLNPIALWVKRAGNSWEFVYALPAHEVRPSEFAIVPFTQSPCFEGDSKPVWSPVPDPLFLGPQASLAPAFVTVLREADALLEEDGVIYAQKAVLLNQAFRDACSNSRWKGP